MKNHKKPLLALLVALTFNSFSHSISESETPLKTVKVGYLSENNPFMSASSNGKKSGYAYDYIQNIANLEGWKFEYVYGSKKELRTKMEKGLIDILPSADLEAKKNGTLLFPQYPMGQRIACLFIKEGNYEISSADPSTLNGKTIGIEKGTFNYSFLQNWFRANKINCKTVFYNSSMELSDALKNGSADAILEADIFAAPDWVSIFKIDRTEFFLAVAPSRPDLVDQINHAMEITTQTNPFYTETLHMKYYLKNLITGRINKEEQNWLNRHFNQIKVACLSNDLPFSAYNKKTQKAEGALVDYLKGTFSALNIPGTSTTYKFNNLAGENIQQLLRQNVDLAFPVLTDINAAENEDYMLSDAIFTIPMGLIYQSNSKKNVFEKLAILDSGVAIPYIKQNFPQCEYMLYSTTGECLEALLNEQCDGVLMNNYRIERILAQNKKFKELKVYDLQQPIKISFAVRRTSPGLLTLVNKGLTRLSESEMKEMLLKYAGSEDKSENHIFMLLSEHIGMMASLLLFSAIVALFLFVLLIKLQLFTNFDPLTHLYTKRNLTPFITNAIDIAQTQGLDFCLAIIEIDDFKKIKKQFGNFACDTILINIACAITSSTKKEDKVIRSGKNQITAILQTNLESAVKSAERIRKEISADPIEFKSSTIPVTVTIGLTQYKPGNTPNQVYSQADKNLFEGIQTGKNKVIW